MKIEIEKDVPLDPPCTIPPLPLEKLDVGHSFRLELERGELDKIAVRQRITRFQQKNPPKKFSIRTIDENTIRVHRRQ